MATDKPRILLTLDEKLLERIDDYRFENRINSRSEAIRSLISEGLKKYEQEKVPSGVRPVQGKDS
jgi:metal-responsive CopG/Arc/MetJ family transcriptional regulator